MIDQWKQHLKLLEELALLEKRIPEQVDYIEEKTATLEELKNFNRSMGLSMWFQKEKQNRLDEILESAKGVLDNLKKREKELINEIKTWH